MTITWLTQGGFLFEASGYRLVVDPYMSDSLAGKVTRLASFPLALGELRPDAVICTHDHLDHLDPDSMTMIAGSYPHCLFGGPEQAHRHLGELGILNPLLLEVGKRIGLGPLSITPAFAKHSDPSAVGLLIGAAGRKVYLTADTEFDEQIFTPLAEGMNAVLICINGRLGNMNWQEAVETVRRLKPSMALPMHYGLFAENTEDPGPFISACREAGIASFEMTPGKPFDL
ncbi:MAG: MBL fold metallo-hydrolase [Verrucomicrobiae bacterium]